MEEINRQLERDPLSEKYLISKAVILFKQKSYPAVIATVEPLIIQNPKNVRALEATAKAYSRLRDYGHAIEFFNRLIELQPSYDSIFLRGSCRSRVGLYKEALEDNDWCIRLRPSDGASYVQRAEIHRSQFGLDEQCEMYMRKAVELSPNDPVVLLEWEKASNLFTKRSKKLRNLE
jgi:tetratricopeptide (TPR) repeat protein